MFASIAPNIEVLAETTNMDTVVLSTSEILSVSLDVVEDNVKNGNFENAKELTKDNSELFSLQVLTLRESNSEITDEVHILLLDMHNEIEPGNEKLVLENIATVKNLLKQYLPGIIAFVAIYLFATIFRDIRDNFSADMWKEMGFNSRPALFTQTEIPITIFILIIMGAVVFIKNSFKALMVAHVFILMGFIIAGVSTYYFSAQLLDPFWWMLLVGLGLYLVYIPFNSIFFDRLIAAFSMKGNAGFFIYVADSVGYVGSVSVMLVKEGMSLEIKWTQFFSQSVMILSFVGVFITLYAMYYFTKKHKASLVAAA